QAPWLTGLRRLSLGVTHLSAAGFATVLSSPHLGQLERLTLDGVELDRRVARALARSPWRSLTHLSLSWCEAADDAVIRTLARSPHLRPTVLELDGLPIGESGAAALVSGRLLERVEKLHVGSNEMTEPA